MANRSYVFARKKGSYWASSVAQWNYDIPVFHLILLSQQSKIVKSELFCNSFDEEPVYAISADFQQGIFAFREFSAKLRQSKLRLNQDLNLLDSLDACEVFLDKLCAENDFDEFLLECTEIFDLDERAYKVLTDELLEQIQNLSIDKIILDAEAILGNSGVDDCIHFLGLACDEVLFYSLAENNE